MNEIKDLTGFIILGILILIGLIISSSSSIYVDDGVIRDEQGESAVQADTNAVQVEDIKLRIATGEVDNFRVIHKFGAGELSTTFNPVTRSGFYRTPTTAVELEFVSNSATDIFTGTGAREITIEGLNATWERVIFTIETNGTSAVTLPHNLTRLYRWFVSSSGTYADQAAASHQGELTIRESGGGDIWSIIPIAPFPIGQSEIGVVSIPKGETAYVLQKSFFTDTTKTADIYFYQRCNINDTTAPYSGTMRLVEREVGVTGGFSLEFVVPKGPFIGPCDIGFMGEVSTGTADSSVEFEIVIIATE